MIPRCIVIKDSKSLIIFALIFKVISLPGIYIRTNTKAVQTTGCQRNEMNRTAIHTVSHDITRSYVARHYMIYNNNKGYYSLDISPKSNNKTTAIIIDNDFKRSFSNFNRIKKITPEIVMAKHKLQS